MGAVALLLALSAAETAQAGAPPAAGNRPRPAATTTRPLSATLTGAAEQPGPGDPDGEGGVTVRVDPRRLRVCYQLSAAAVATPTAAHIHKAPANAAGPPVVALTPPTAGASTGCAAIDRSVAEDLLRNPGAYYVNVHNAEFPAGAVRGQLTR
jgi:hypothetical protein